MTVSRTHPCDSSQSSTAAFVFRDLEVSPGDIWYVSRRGDEESEDAADAKARSKTGV